MMVSQEATKGIFKTVGEVLVSPLTFLGVGRKKAQEQKADAASAKQNLIKSEFEFQKSLGVDEDKARKIAYAKHGGGCEKSSIRSAKMIILVLFLVIALAYFYYGSTLLRNATLFLGVAYIGLFVYSKFAKKSQSLPSPSDTKIAPLNGEESSLVDFRLTQGKE